MKERGTEGRVEGDVLWMVRKPDGQILGPYSQSIVEGLLSRGELQPRDEMARENSYWFSCEDRKERDAFFPGLAVRFSSQKGAGLDEQDTLTDWEPTSPTSAMTGPSEATGATVFAEPKRVSLTPSATARGFKETQGPVPVPLVKERSRLWTVVLLALAFGLGLALVFIWKSFRQNPAL